MNSEYLRCPRSAFYLRLLTFFSPYSLFCDFNLGVVLFLGPVSVLHYVLYLLFNIFSPFSSLPSLAHAWNAFPSLPFAVSIGTIDPGLLKGAPPSLICTVSQSCDHWAGSVPRPDSHYEDWLATAAPTHLAGWQRCPLLPLSNNPLL